MNDSVSLSRRVGGIVVAVVALAIAYFIPGSEALSHEGVTTFGILVALAVLWSTSALPVGIIALLVPLLILILGIGTLADGFSGYSSTALYFIVAIFSIPVIMLKTKWGIRIINLLLKWTKNDARKIVLGFMIGTAVVSMFMSDVPCTILFLGFALTILKAAGAKPGESNLGKCLMIGIPVAAVLGGIATPAGSSFNVVAMNMLTAATGQTISFLNWMIVGLPIVILTTPVSWFFITLIIKPEPINDSCLNDIRAEAAASTSIDSVDVKALVVLLAMVVLWIAGNWITIFNATAVALVGLIAMFLPGMNLITWKEFQEAVPWSIILMVGTIMTLGNLVGSTGGAAFIANLITGSGLMDLNFFVLFFVILLIVYLFHTICPIGPAILGVFVPIMITVCATLGISAAVPTIALAAMVAGNMLLPVNPTVMLTFGEGYYKFLDMFKTGIVPALFMLVVCAAWIPFIVGVLGI